MLARLSLAAALALCALPLAGCATADGMQEKFYDASRGYNRSLRWGDFDRAADYLPPISVDAFLETHEEVADKLLILDYQLTRLQLDKMSGKAGSRVEVRWHTDDSTIVRETVVDQQWQFWEGSWYLVDERRARGKPLAIFAEIPEDEEGEPQPDSPHPYLPGLDEFRDKHEIGMSPKQKRDRDRVRRRAKRKGGKDAMGEDALGNDSVVSQSSFDDAPGT
jgi:hypothetical protein